MPIKKLLGPLYPMAKISLLALALLSLSRMINTGLFFDHVSSRIQLWELFGNGLRVDLVLLAYFLGIPFLIFGIAHTFGKPTVPVLKSFITYWAVLVILAIVFFEAITPFYILEYGTRPERKFFEYLGHPKEVFLMLSGTYGFTAIVLIFILSISAPLLYYFINRSFLGLNSWSKKTAYAALPVFVVLLALAGRSSLDHRPINPSTVAFSDDVLLNNLALNSVYSVLYAVYRLKDEEDAASMYGNLSDEEIQHYVYDTRYHPTSAANHQDVSATAFGTKKNLVIILEESLGARFVERLGGAPLTPNLNRLSNDGWWFENLYATGTRSVRGLEAVLTGFLPTPGRSVVKLASAQSSFFTLASLLKEHGYSRNFYYGGNAHFDNMKGFFLSNGFEKVIEQKDFDHSHYIGSWGVSDDDVFNRMHTDLMFTSNTPQLMAVLTTSNHSPFDFPVNAGDSYTQPLKSRENAIRYADRALGRFIDKAKKSPYWENTVFLIVADHDLRVADFISIKDEHIPGQTIRIFPVEGFRIPGLILGGGITPKITQAIISQIDLPVTLLSMLNIKDKTPMIGTDLTSIDPAYQGRAIMQFADHQAFLENNEIVILRPSQPPLTGHYSKGSFQSSMVSNDLEKKALAHALWASKMYKQHLYN